MKIQIETVTAAAFSMDYFRFGHGEKTLVILPGLSVQSVMGFADSVTDEDLKRFIILGEGMRGFDVTGRLTDISCPALVIGSLDDRVLGPDASVRIAAHLNVQKGVVLYMYNRYGHAAYDTAPDYKERILQFLEAGSAD